jgi:hypothetical protein
MNNKSMNYKSMKYKSIKYKSMKYKSIKYKRDFVRVVKELDLRPNATLARGFEPHRSQKGGNPLEPP